jgi:hypothetical protein
MDDKVIERLLGRKDAVNSAIGDFKRALLGLVRAELPDAQFHTNHVQRFDHAGETWSTEWTEADEKGWRFFRIGDHGLADQLLLQAKDRAIGTAHLQFHYDAYEGNLSSVRPLIGQSGWMRVARLTLHTPARTYDEIVCAAMADDGSALHPEVAERMLQIPAVDLGGIDDLQQTGGLAADGRIHQLSLHDRQKPELLCPGPEPDDL